MTRQSGPCPVCSDPECPSWALRKNETWHLPPTPAGTLRPCGDNPAGTVLEFFANPEDIPELLTAGITATIDGVRTHYTVRLTSTPHYQNGDVQIQALKQL